LASRVASYGCLQQLLWLSELQSTPTLGRTRWTSTRCTSTEIGTSNGFHTCNFDHHVVRATAPEPTPMSCTCGTPTPATVSAHPVALLLLPPGSPRRRGVVHGDSSGAAFSTAPSCPPAAILPLHCSRAPLAGYRCSPPGRPWPPVMMCFKCFRRMFSSVSSRCCVCCKRMFHDASICFKCF
jgi:hypothetical protein